MESRNPYAPSAASLRSKDIPAPGSHAWRDGKLLVVKLDGSIPKRCVRCNEPVDAPIKARKVYWHHPSIYFTIFLSPLLYVIVAVIARKKAVVAPGLCPEHSKRRQRIMMFNLLGIALGIGAIFVGASIDRPELLSLGILAVLVALILLAIFTRIVTPKHIDKEFVRLKGCGVEFLNALPPLSR